MKIIQDPSVSGFKAKTGLFISVEDFSLLRGLLKSIRKNVQREACKASAKYEHYKDIHEYGEATSRQCTLMDEWEEKLLTLEGIDNTLAELESLLAKKGGAL